MDSEEETKKKVDHLHAAVHQLLEHRRLNSNRNREESRLLSRLLCQLESLEEDTQPTCLTKCPCGAKCCGANQEAGNEEIARELKSIKKQNLISHCLLAVMIVVMAAWQISEVSLLLSVKEKLSNPLKIVGNLLRNSIKWREKKTEIEGTALPIIELPQIPDIDLAFLPFSNSNNSNGNTKNNDEV
ncbi:uncharacterized protein LOC110028542 isoform X2 [Phalaenopsis equestris]|uniref:uncharacterized protein LOC110028542 isoform X2 n=1 Tax=Phalaenopsis equestris TaxID=78828 RepID=UPI0009E63185|nr:uncharacterized protein LOC110028542 isoform X2 [Phalaenopsis equestris]